MMNGVLYHRKTLQCSNAVYKYSNGNGDCWRNRLYPIYFIRTDLSLFNGLAKLYGNIEIWKNIFDSPTKL